MMNLESIWTFMGYEAREDVQIDGKTVEIEYSLRERIQFKPSDPKYTLYIAGPAREQYFVRKADDVERHMAAYKKKLT